MFESEPSKRAGRLVFRTHDVRKQPWPNKITHSTFRALVDCRLHRGRGVHGVPSVRQDRRIRRCCGFGDESRD